MTNTRYDMYPDPMLRRADNGKVSSWVYKIKTSELPACVGSNGTPKSNCVTKSVLGMVPYSAIMFWSVSGKDGTILSEVDLILGF